MSKETIVWKSTDKEMPDDGIDVLVKTPGNGETYMRVTYEIPPTRAIKWQDFEEQALSDEGVYACLARTYPGWAIKKLERNLPIKGDSDGERGRWLL